MSYVMVIWAFVLLQVVLLATSLNPIVLITFGVTLGLALLVTATEFST